MGKNTPDTQTTVQTNEPPAYVKPYIERGLQRAESLYGLPLFSGPTFNPLQQQGMGAIAGAAGSPMLTGPATQYAQDVIGGEYLRPEAIAEAADPFVRDFLGQHNRAFEMSGGRGGSLEAEAAGRGIADVIAGQYGQERALQQQAASMAPQLEAARYAPGQTLLNLGGFQQQAETQRLREPWERVSLVNQMALGQAPAQIAGGTQTGQQPIYQPSPFQQTVGLGASLIPFFL